MRVAVVGAGIAGASAARQFGERGHSVTVFEQFPIGHTRGSSHGRSRIVRRAYPDRFYTQCMSAAYPMWSELERAAGVQLLHEVGLLYFGRRDAPGVSSVIGGLSELRVPHELMNPSEARAVLPGLKLAEGEVGIFTPEAGWVNADLALDATLRLARAAGCKLRIERATTSLLAGFDRVVICAGSWIRDWWPEAPVRVSLQTFAYIQGELSGPVWIEDDNWNFCYGIPSVGDEGFKVGVHRQGPEFSPSRTDREPSQESLAAIREVATRRFGLQSPILEEPTTCLYTNTPTEDFLIRRMDERTWLAGACSGHGFKFGPWIGKLLADLAEGRDELANYPRFGTL